MLLINVVNEKLIINYKTCYKFSYESCASLQPQPNRHKKIKINEGIAVFNMSLENIRTIVRFLSGVN